jgi:hypothetical protein
MLKRRWLYEASCFGISNWSVFTYVDEENLRNLIQQISISTMWQTKKKSNRFKKS